MHILLTGSNGFLGSALARHWAKRGHQLTLLARSSSNLERLSGLKDSVRLLFGSSSDEVIGVVHAAMPDVIVHTACSYGRRGESLLDLMGVNLFFGTALLQALLTNSAQNKGPVTFLNTGTALASEVSLYSLSKTHFSSWGAAVATQSPDRLRFIDIRLQQIYGPGDERSKFTTNVIEACLSNEPRLALTRGEQRRDFIHIDDVVGAYDCILEQRNGFQTNDAVDVGSGESITIRDFVELVKKVTGASTFLDFDAVSYREKEPMLCVADITRLRCLGWQPTVSLKDGIARMKIDRAV